MEEMPLKSAEPFPREHVKRETHATKAERRALVQQTYHEWQSCILGLVEKAWVPYCQLRQMGQEWSTA